MQCPGIVEASGATELNESRNLVVACLGPDVLESHNDREVAFTRLPPGHRPDTVVLRGIPANWVAQDGRPADATSAPVSLGSSSFGLTDESVLDTVWGTLSRTIAEKQ